MKKALLLGAALILLAPAAFAASDAGNRQPMPANGYSVDRSVEAWKAKEERIYNNPQTGRSMEDNQHVDGNAYGDQVNELPAREKYYNSPKGYMPAAYQGRSKRDCY